MICKNFLYLLLHDLSHTYTTNLGDIACFFRTYKRVVCNPKDDNIERE